jgi:hypothetical protein
MNTLNGRLTFLLENQKDLLSFLKTKYKLFHLSNVFFRDLHYGVMSYLEWKDKPLHYSEAEDLTKQLIAKLESAGVLKNVDHHAFLLQYPEFKKPLVKPAVPAKPAAPAAKPAAPLAIAPAATPAAVSEPKAPSPSPV